MTKKKLAHRFQGTRKCVPFSHPALVGGIADLGLMYVTSDGPNDGPNSIIMCLGRSLQQWTRVCYGPRTAQFSAPCSQV